MLSLESNGCSDFTSAPYDRLIAPAYDYVPTFQTALLRLRLAVAGANLVTQDAHASFQTAAAQLLTQANAAGGTGMPTAVVVRSGSRGWRGLDMSGGWLASCQSPLCWADCDVPDLSASGPHIQAVVGQSAAHLPAGIPPTQQLAATGGFGGPQFGGASSGYGYAPDGHGGGGALGYGGPPGFAMAGFGGGGFAAANGQHQPLAGPLHPVDEDDEDEEAVDTVDTYAAAGMYVMASPAHLQQQAGFLLQQLAPFAGRHIITASSLETAPHHDTSNRSRVNLLTACWMDGR